MERNQSVPMLFPIEPSEFWAQIRQIVHEEVGNTQRHRPVVENEEPLLQRKEIAKMLRISLVTLNDWVKRGLPSHKQRGKVYFLHSEVMKYIKQNKWKKALEFQ